LKVQVAYSFLEVPHECRIVGKHGTWLSLGTSLPDPARLPVVLVGT